MKVKLAELAGSVEALRALSSTKLPVVTAFKVAFILRKIREPLEAFDETRNKLLAQHGKAVKGQEGIFTMDAAKAKKLFDPLLAQEIEIPGQPFTLKDFGSIDVEPATIASLAWCIQINPTGAP